LPWQCPLLGTDADWLNGNHGRYPAAGSSDPKGQIHLLLTFELFICNDRFALRLALASEPFSLMGRNRCLPSRWFVCC
jgi:hypothetical protein